MVVGGAGDVGVKVGAAARAAFAVAVLGVGMLVSPAGVPGEQAAKASRAVQTEEAVSANEIREEAIMTVQTTDYSIRMSPFCHYLTTPYPTTLSHYANPACEVAPSC